MRDVNAVIFQFFHRNRVRLKVQHNSSINKGSKEIEKLRHIAVGIG